MKTNKWNLTRICSTTAVIGLAVAISSLLAINYDKSIDTLSDIEAQQCQGSCDAKIELKFQDPETYYSATWVPVFVRAERDANDPNLDGSITLNPSTGDWENKVLEILDFTWCVSYEISGEKLVLDAGGTLKYDDGSYSDFITAKARHRLFGGSTWSVNFTGWAKKRNLFGTGDGQVQYGLGIEGGFRF